MILFIGILFIFMYIFCFYFLYIIEFQYLLKAHQIIHIILLLYHFIELSYLNIFTLIRDPVGLLLHHEVLLIIISLKIMMLNLIQLIAFNFKHGMLYKIIYVFFLRELMIIRWLRNLQLEYDVTDLISDSLQILHHFNFFMF